MAKREIKDEQPDIFTLGDEYPLVEGYFLRERQGKFGTLYDFVGPGNVVFSVKGNADLLGKMVQVPKHAYVWLSYLGMKTVGKGNAMKQIRVEVDAENLYKG